MQHHRRTLRSAAAPTLTILSLSGALALGCGNSSAGPGTGGTSGVGGAVGAVGGTGGGGSGVPWEEELPVPAEPVSAFLVLDQFGYLPDSEKIAVLRDPEVGFDAADASTPGSKYELVNAVSGAVALEMTATAFGAGAVHEQSGDRAHWLDFSSVTEPGVYYVRDVDAGTRSDLFRIATDAYKRALHHAFRTFFYQRAGFPKEAPFAEEGFTDGASHVGPGQDRNALRLMGDASTERDVSGGWYDAGDYNKYTAWTADYVVTLLRAYEETPAVFGDDFGIPESGNGTSDLLDEVRFGVEHLLRLQLENGAFLSIVQLDGASPPSAATGASTYGPESTNATIRGGLALAWAARLFEGVDADFAASLEAKAILAWGWAEANPAVTFANTGVLGAGEQQASEKEVGLYKLGLAVALYRITGDATYKTFFEANYAAAGLSVLSGYNAAWEVQFTEYFLDYAKLPDADPTVSGAILSAYNQTIASADNLGQIAAPTDPYLAYVADYTWGSNAHKSRTGCLLHDVVSFSTDPTKDADARRAAERYVHYLHGVNPLGLVYLSNMGRFGAHKSVTTFYHTWFADQSPAWDEVGVSTYGPAPGFLVGGPNPSYDWDGQCPGHASCPAARPTPPYGQPAMKSYAQFNDNWPVNSWAVTENSNGYQTYYLRLLAKFVR